MAKHLNSDLQKMFYFRFRCLFVQIIRGSHEIESEHFKIEQKLGVYWYWVLTIYSLYMWL